MMRNFRKLSLGLCCAALSLSLFCLPAAAVNIGDNEVYDDFGVKCGDVNADGRVDILDLIRFKRHAAGDEEIDFAYDNADCDGDGQVDGDAADDMRELRKYLLDVIDRLGR